MNFLSNNWVISISYGENGITKEALLSNWPRFYGLYAFTNVFSQKGTKEKYFEFFMKRKHNRYIRASNYPKIIQHMSVKVYIYIYIYI